MVRWRGRRGSSNIEDRRGAAAGVSGLLFFILRFVFSRFGVVGVLALVGGFFALRAVGLDPLALLGGGSGAPAKVSAEDQEAYDFSSVILAGTETVWSDLFAQAGSRYAPPTLVVYTNATGTACGYGSAAAGPFYCPLDQNLYLDTAFFDELARRFGAPGDFAAAYVIAHEVGHHVQALTGIADEVRRRQASMDEAARNRVQVMMELQADCYAGIWANHSKEILEAGDIEEGLNAASAIGDDTLQRNMGRRVTPESFTHGSSKQRVQWFTAGYKSGSVTDCDTFGASGM